MNIYQLSNDAMLDQWNRIRLNAVDFWKYWNPARTAYILKNGGSAIAYPMRVLSPDGRYYRHIVGRIEFSHYQHGLLYVYQNKGLEWIDTTDEHCIPLSELFN